MNKAEMYEITFAANLNWRGHSVNYITIYLNKSSAYSDGNYKT